MSRFIAKNSYRHFLALGTASLTDTSYSWQHCHSTVWVAHGRTVVLLHHPDGTVPGFGRRPMSVSVAVGSPVHSSDGTTLLPLASDTITSSNLPESASASLFGGSCTTDTILLCNRRVTSRPDSGRHSALFMENVPKVTHTLNSGSNIFIPRCLIHRIVLSAGRNITLLIAGLNGYPVCPPTSRDTHVLSSRRP